MSRLLPAALLVAAVALPPDARAQTRRATPRSAAATSVDDARELTADQQVRHALARLTFGARPGDETGVRAIGVDAWIQQQLHPERIDDGALEATLAALPTLGRSSAELLRAYPPPGQLLARRALAARMAGDTGATLDAADSARARALARASYRVVGELQAARMARAVASERQLQEVMVDFWANHFSVFARKDRVRYFLPEYEATLRAHAFGRFRDLLGAVATSPAMLQYLDNAQSVADGGRPTLGRPRARGAATAVAPRRPRGVNENYARELLELHTLGVDGGYTQADVVAVARALTGWSLRPPQQGGGFVFRPAAHDAGEKTVLGRMLPAGRGIEDGEAVLDLLARHPSTARHIARKLAVRFVSDSPPPALVERAAATFRRTDGDVRATLETIVTSPEFFSRAAYRAKVKSPLELVASTARALGAAPDTTARTAQLVARLGQPLYGHQAPDGWPETGRAWMNGGAILNRINFGLSVAAGRLPNARLADWPLADSLRTAPRDAQLDGVARALLGGELSPDTRAILAGGANPLLPRDDARRPALDPFAQLVGLALGAPEFQRR